ncbi:hypothetical protein BMS3Bbin04_00016 [bacterium BMS3Bbin04]|nr:hypothetical protein BMS3Bbin04_00016 [bacterium BMS3Bbin04]
MATIMNGQALAQIVFDIGIQRYFTIHITPQVVLCIIVGVITRPPLEVLPRTKVSPQLILKIVP